MKKLTLGTAMIAALMSFSACAGGDGPTGGDGSITPPDDIGGGAFGLDPSNSASLINFVTSGGEDISHKASDNNNLKRIQRSEVVGSGHVTVTADIFPDGTYGVIQYVTEDNATFYTLDGGMVSSTDFPDGLYQGAFDMSYTVDGGESWSNGAGEAAIVIDSTTTTAFFDGYVIPSDKGDGPAMVEVFSSGVYDGSQFTHNDARIFYSKDGVYASDHTGTVEANMYGDGQDGGAIGFVNVNEDGFEATGGFTATLDR